jgi:pseudomonalisin/xanthomonalisin
MRPPDHAERANLFGASFEIEDSMHDLQIAKMSLALLIGTCALGLNATAAPATPSTWAATSTQAHDVRGARDLGPLREGETVHIAVALKLRDRAGLDRFTQRLLSHPGERPMTHEAFLRRHAPSEREARAVAQYLTQQGFHNVQIAEDRLLVTADGTAGAVKGAFRTELHHYDARGRLAYANVSPALVPASLSGTVLAVLGLQTVHMAHTTLKPATRSGARVQDVTGVDPTQFPGIYGADGLPAATSATIGIITAGDMTQTLSDLNTFASNAGYAPPPASVVQVGQASSDTSGTGEWNMDTQASLAAAGGSVSQMLLYTAPSLSDADLTADYNQVVSDNKAQVINVSLGECENDAASSGTEASNDQIFQSAVAQGQTFSVSSGDSGSYECGGSTSYQSYPAVSPYVMAIGGTTLSSSGGVWQGETAWSCSGPQDCPQSASGGTGGGVSATEAAPSWQTASGVLGGSSQRGVPDVSFDAAPSSGALILVNGATQQIGGTSLAAPLFTGFYARIVAAGGGSPTFPAQALYQGAASNPSWFHDVTQGGNGGYSAGAGWDYVTGFGSLNVGNFAGGTGAGAASNMSARAHR